MKNIKTFKNTYPKGDYLLVDHNTRLEERDFNALKGLNDIKGINGDIRGIDTFDTNPSIVEVKKVEWYDSESKKYVTEFLFLGLELYVDESDIIENLTDDRLIEEISKMEHKISEHIELHQAKKEGEKYNI